MTELAAFQNADFNWTRSQKSIWDTAYAWDDGPNSHLIDEIVADLPRAQSIGSRGRALLGNPGIGKTHLIGELRHKTWEAGGWFVLLEVVGAADFWRSAALSFITSLQQEMPTKRRQVEAVIASIACKLKVEKELEAVPASSPIIQREVIDLLVQSLTHLDKPHAQRFGDILRSLILLSSSDPDISGLAYSWLQSFDSDPELANKMGYRSAAPSPEEVVKGVCWTMNISAPSVIAVDEIDGIIHASGSLEAELLHTTDFCRTLGMGLLGLYTISDRSMIAVTCLLRSWEAIRGANLDSFKERFEVLPPLAGLQNDAAIEAMLSARLRPAFEQMGVAMPWPTWPFSGRAIEEASKIGMFPRRILMACESHRKACIRTKVVTKLDSFIQTDGGGAPPVVVNEWQTLLEQGRKTASPADLSDDQYIPQLIHDALDLYVTQSEIPSNIDLVNEGDVRKRNPPLHGRLIFTFTDENARQAYFCFRAIEQSHANSFLARLRAAVTASGISSKLPDHHLFVVRGRPIPNGPMCKQLSEAFQKAGGKILNPQDIDLRTFQTLLSMRSQAAKEGKVADFEAWLQQAKPLCHTAFFKEAGLCPPPLGSGQLEARPPDNSSPDPARPQKPISEHPLERTTPTPPEPTSTVSTPVEPTRVAPPASPSPASAIPIGHRAGIGSETVELPIDVLPRHTAIIAGAGSGKTVLLRRIVEEAALAGIPAIVVDPNNDLSRLGDPWPERPPGFTDADAAKAELYAETVEVVVWTPGVRAGNPLFLPVLPDFAAIGDDPDERAQAITMAAETLGPLAGAKTNLLKGVLSDALRHFARTGGTLKDMTALLAELPEGVSEIGNAEKLAARMADELKAAVATNPLLRATGPVLDPKLLFYGPDARRTRVSVINLSGLASDEAKEDFVNRLQMTLFGWVKRHPSPRGMLYVIDEAQIFIPSGAGALSKTSGVQLVAQARKYGLGMIAVTQAPKGIDNKVVSNCTTQFLGKQNAPATIDAAKSLIVESGGRADDIGKLATGEFYFKTEKSGKPFKLRTPICLSWHPANPPTPDEVVARARKSAPDG